MPDAAFKVYFNNLPAADDLLERIEEIIVDQEVDMATEARIKVPVSVNEMGKWTDEDADFITPFSRIRVEIIVENLQPVALIDGPIVASENHLSSDPGESFLSLIVQDDSAFLNREEKFVLYDNMSDDEVAQKIFKEIPQIADTDIEKTKKSSGSASSVVQRGTGMELLRELARRHGMHTYVLPGSNPGQSIGCFKAIMNQSSGLPPLTLLGENRTLQTFSVRHDFMLPSKVRAFTLNIADKSISESVAVYSDAEKLGEEEAIQKPSDMSVQLLSPYTDFSTSADSIVASRAAISGFAFEAKGSPNDKYTGVLQPYNVVDILGVNSRLSGKYLISRVTHTLTRSSYGQQFIALRNAMSGGSTANGAKPRGIF